MNNNIPRQIHPVESRKRKETAGSASSQPAASASASASSQQLLAGYMAYEFLTRGTLLGQELDPARAEAAALSASSKMRPKSEEVAMRSGGEQQQKKRRYAEVASLLKTDGAHLPWVVNPTQLARWVGQM